VQKLAERSKLAANEIALISKSSVSVTEESDRLINELTPEIERTAKLVQEIVLANKEQRIGVMQVNRALSDLNRIIQQNAAASEELACSAEELASQADQLKSMISYFKVRIL
jgi:methyl-accepting chemotaxis protein